MAHFKEKKKLLVWAHIIIVFFQGAHNNFLFFDEVGLMIIMPDLSVENQLWAWTPDGV